MTMIMYSATTQIITQPVKILTDVEIAHPTVICPITAVLTPARPYLSISADSATITLDGSKASDLDVGIQTITLTVNSKSFSTLVTQATYTFQLDLQACVVSTFAFS